MTVRGTMPIDRRSFVSAAGGVSLAVVLAACGSQRDPVPSAYRGEYRTIALAAALENQAVAVYRAFLGALHAGTLRVSSPAFTSLVRTCAIQHAQHAYAWNAILSSGHKPSVNGVPLTAHARVMRAASAAATLDHAAELCLRLERQAAQTYVLAAGTLATPAAVAAAAGIAPVEAMHAAILAFMAGSYPTPANLGETAAAARTSELTI